MLLVEGQFCEARPELGRRCAPDLEYLDQLVVVTLACKEGVSVDNFGKDAADRPDVNRGCVVLGAKQDVGGTVPERDDFVREVLNRDAEGTSQTKVSKLQQSFPIDQQILRL